MTTSYGSYVDPRRRQIILIGLIDAVERSGTRPVEAKRMHTLWYLANALAPARGLAPFDAAVFKTDKQPYFPGVQADIDSLVGRGLLAVADLATTDDGLRIQGRFVVNRDFCDRVLSSMRGIPEEANLLDFLDDVVQATNRLSDVEQAVALTQDATYGDPRVDTGNVVDLGRWIHPDATTPTQYVLAKLQSVAGRKLKPAELMELYMDHLGWRLRNGK